MNIGIVSGFFLPVPPVCGGATEKLTFALSRELVSLGHEVLIYSRSWPGWPDSEVRDGVSFLRIPGLDHSRSLAWNLLCDTLWSIRVGRKVRPHDVLITHSVVFPLAPWNGAKRLPVIPWLGRMPKGQCALYGNVAGVIAPSGAVAERALRENPALADRIVRIPNLIDTARFSRAAKHRGSDPVVAFVGRLHPEKGLDLLLDAAERWNARLTPTWKLDIMGPWEERLGGGGARYHRHLVQRAKRIGPHVRVLAACFDDAALADFYSAADVFCYPSLAETGEALSVAPIEAMAAGAVPVLSDLACFADLVVDGGGVTFDHRGNGAADRLADTLAGLVADTPRRKSLSDAARVSAAKFDVTVTAPKLITAIATLLARSCNITQPTR